MKSTRNDSGIFYVSSKDLDRDFNLINKDRLCGKVIKSVWLPHDVTREDVEGKDWFVSIEKSNPGVEVRTVALVDQLILDEAISQRAPVPEASPSGPSIKNDRLDHKLRWELLPLDLVEHLVAVYTYGAEKYSENSWQNLPDGYRRYKAALFRHIVAFEKGEKVDPESGLPHLAHAAWNALALIHFTKEQ